MKQFIKSLLCIALLGGTAHAAVLPYISIRSQSENAARELVLWQTQINRFCMDELYGSFSITPEYTQTFQAKKIGKLLFNDALDKSCKSDCVTFKVQGSAVANRDPKAWLADNFGLPLDYSSTVKICPKIENILVDFDLYLGLDHWMNGLYFRIHAPVVNTRWTLEFCEKDPYAGVMNAPVGYYNSTLNGEGTTDAPYYGVLRSDLVGTFAGFVSRCEVPDIEGITFNSLANARFADETLKRTRLSDIQAAFGWNFWQNECYHLGLNIRGAAPTGNRPHAAYIFEPIVGNGHHWELGAGLTSHLTLWRSCDEDKEFNVYLDANITHLFKDRQCRTFDMCCKPLSRYMLAMKMTNEVENLINIQTGAPISYQFDGEFSSVANLSTIKVDVSAAVQADIALKFAYTHCNYQFDIGYEFWARSREKICPPDCESFCKTKCCPTVDHEYWALKGDAFVYAFPYRPDIRPIGTPVALSSSERDAQIFCGTGNYFRTTPSWYSNPGVDNAQIAFNGSDQELINWVDGLSTDRIGVFTSVNPYVFDTADTKQWDFDTAQARGISNKIFANLGYTWDSREHRCIEWTPYLGVGGEVEFGSVDNLCCTECQATCTTKTPVITQARCGSCSKESSSKCESTPKETKCCNIGGAVSQWGIWLKGGISFK